MTLRIPIFVKQCTNWAQIGQTRNQNLLCWSWNVQQFHFRVTLFPLSLEKSSKAELLVTTTSFIHLSFWHTVSRLEQTATFKIKFSLFDERPAKHQCLLTRNNKKKKPVWKKSTSQKICYQHYLTIPITQFSDPPMQQYQQLFLDFRKNISFNIGDSVKKIHPVSTPTNAAKQMAGEKLFRRSASLHTCHCLQKTDCQSKNDIK